MLKKFDVTLRPLEESDLEDVLMWRNSDHIRCYALNQEIITLEQHKKWFNSLAKKGDEYYIIEKNSTKVGLIWAKNIAHDECESGFYLYDTSVQNTLFAYRVAITLNDYLFNEKQLEKIYCDILNTNERSIRFSFSLGYTKIKEFHTHSYYELHKKKYEKCSQKIVKHLT